jgi:ribosomal protein S25
VDFLKLLPETLPKAFTTRMLAKESKLRINLAQKMVYCLRNMDVIRQTGKKGRAFLYSVA